jgi:beta-phosphoglucomutase-like phosphatase (HAD superfamily)
MLRALLLDFNGTLSDDEELQFGIYRGLLEESGYLLTHDEYFGHLVGLSDRDVIRRCLGPDADVERLVSERVDRFAAVSADGSTVSREAREAVRLAAASVKVAIVSSAFRREVVPILEAAGLEGLFAAIVTADDVEELKPSPEPYLIACSRLGIAPAEGLAIEDSEAGVTSARLAGLRCAAVTINCPAERLAGAEVLIERLDARAVRLLLSPAAQSGPA